MIGLGAERDRASVEELRQHPPPLLSGLATSLSKLAELDEHLSPAGQRIRPHAIFTSGENLFDDTRAALEAWFGCRVYNGYASSEGGCMAIECPFGTELHVRTEHCELEVLCGDGTLAAEGSGELVVTNYGNWAMPFIRYRTGDWGTLRVTRCACGHLGPTLVDLPGREAVSFETPYGTIQSSWLDQALGACPIKQFQLVQEAPSTFRFRWVPARQCASADDVESRLANMMSRFGQLQITFLRVDDTTTPGRKIRRYVNLQQSTLGAFE
jgi:phenylacetate-CoA ligase